MADLCHVVLAYHSGRDHLLPRHYNFNLYFYQELAERCPRLLLSDRGSDGVLLSRW